MATAAELATRPRSSAGAAAAALLLAIAGAMPIAWLQARPHDLREVAVIFAPWTTPDAVLARVRAADGLIVRAGAFSGIVVVHGDSPELASRLYRAGAWAVLDPIAFGGCLVATGIRPDASS